MDSSSYSKKWERQQFVIPTTADIYFNCQAHLLPSLCLAATCRKREERNTELISKQKLKSLNRMWKDVFLTCFFSSQQEIVPLRQPVGSSTRHYKVMLLLFFFWKKQGGKRVPWRRQIVSVPRLSATLWHWWKRVSKLNIFCYFSLSRLQRKGFFFCSFLFRLWVSGVETNNTQKSKEQQKK